MKKLVFNLSDDNAKDLTKKEKQAVNHYVSNDINNGVKWVKIIKQMPFDIDLEAIAYDSSLELNNGANIPINDIKFNRNKWCATSPKIFSLLRKINSEVSIAIIEFISYNITYNSNIITITDEDIDKITCNKQVFERNIRQLMTYNIIARTNYKDIFVVNPEYIFYGKYKEFIMNYKKLYEGIPIEYNKYGRIIIK